MTDRQDSSDDDRPTSSVPDASRLERLPTDLWSRLLPHVRAAMNGLDDRLVTPRMEQLRAAPTSRLVGGRSRRDLCRLLAAGGPLWRRTRELVDEAGDAGLLAVLAGEEPLTPEPPASMDSAEAARRELEERLERVRRRNRELLAERDDARRRAEGLEARLRVEQERLGAVEDELAAMTDDRDRLAADLDAAAQERATAVDRARRRAESDLAHVQEELRRLRRREQERRERRRRRDPGGGTDGVEERAREEVAAYRRHRRPAPRHADAGRPSRLPPGIAPGTADALHAMLTPGRLVLVDGYNVTKQHRGHLDLEHQRGWLTRRLETLATRTRADITIVFDGEASVRAPTPSSRHVALRFSADRSADDEIVALAGSVGEEVPVLVVTDDRELRERVTRLRVDVIGTAPLVAVS